MNRRYALLVATLVLVASGCGSSRPTSGGVRSGPVWTSSAEPSPPGSSSNWAPADERQLRP